MNVPCSVSSVGTLPSGLARRKSTSSSLHTSVGTSSIRSARPASCAKTRTLRTKGEAGEYRSRIVWPLCQVQQLRQEHREPLDVGDDQERDDQHGEKRDQRHDDLLEGNLGDRAGQIETGAR